MIISAVSAAGNDVETSTPKEHHPCLSGGDKFNKATLGLTIPDLMSFGTSDKKTGMYDEVPASTNFRIPGPMKKLLIKKAPGYSAHGLSTSKCIWHNSTLTSSLWRRARAASKVLGAAATPCTKTREFDVITDTASSAVTTLGILFRVSRLLVWICIDFW